MSDSRIRVAVVFGGRSSEHAISCATAAGVLGAIDRDRYEVVPIGITPKGHWVLAADDPDRWALGTGSAGGRVGNELGPVALALGEGRGGLITGEPGEVPRELGTVDVVFPLLHGPFGEDGTIQGLLELAGVPYVGSGVLASAVGMDKHYMKAVLQDAGLPMGPHLTVAPGRWDRAPQEVTAAAADLGWPVFVKPARAGSSVGVSRAEGPDELPRAMALALAEDPKVLIEAAVVGREIEVAVLQGRDGGPPRTTMPGEIVVAAGEGFYDFESKYIDPDAAELSCPAVLPDEVTDQVRALAAECFEALGCEGLARVDFFYTDDGRVLVNEINTMPGFTPISMFPKLWQHAGMTYPDLISELIELARHRPTGLR